MKGFSMKKNKNNHEFDFAINRPQYFANLMQKTNRALGKKFDDDRFNAYKSKIKKIGIHLFNQKKCYLSINIFCSFLVRRAFMQCKLEKDNFMSSVERVEQKCKENFAKFDKFALSIKGY